MFTNSNAMPNSDAKVTPSSQSWKAGNQNNEDEDEDGFFLSKASSVIILVVRILLIIAVIVGLLSICLALS